MMIMRPPQRVAGDRNDRSVQPASANIVTVVPRMSWKWRSTMPAALQLFSHCYARYRLLHDRPVFVARITAARRYAASSVHFKAFVQGTRIKVASRPRRRALPCRRDGRFVRANFWRTRVSAGSGRRAAQEVEAITLCSPQRWAL